MLNDSGTALFLYRMPLVVCFTYHHKTHSDSYLRSEASCRIRTASVLAGVEGGIVFRHIVRIEGFLTEATKGPSERRSFHWLRLFFSENCFLVSGAKAT